MLRIKLHQIEDGLMVSPPPATPPGSVPITDETGEVVWAEPVPVPPLGTPAGYVPVTDGDGVVTWQPVVAATRREVMMASGVTPPEPLVSGDGYDWIYGEVPA